MPITTFIVPAAILFTGFLVIPTIYNYYVTVDGEYGPWSGWSKCLKTCGDSYQGRYRKCVKQPTGFGKTCVVLGGHVDTRKCNLTPCPIDGGVGEWGEWEKCDRDCKEGKIPRRRYCDNPLPKFHGLPCEEPLIEYKACPSTKECAINGRYDRWSAFTKCSKTCGGGHKKRFRKCIPAQFGGIPCIKLGNPVDIQECNNMPCPKIDGKYGEWTAWSVCSKTCDDGEEIRTRICIPPENGGIDCVGPSEEKRKCNKGACSRGSNSTTVKP